MGAEYTLHIKTNDITEEDMELFFHNHLGSKYDPYSRFIKALGDSFQTIMEDVNKNVNAEGDLRVVLNKYPGAFEAYEKWMADSERLYNLSIDKHDQLYDKFSESPQFEVGECSFLKANMSGDNESYIPDLVSICCDVVDDGRIIDDEMISQIKEMSKTAEQHEYYHTSSINDLLTWLEMHKGEYVFSIAW